MATYDLIRDYTKDPAEIEFENLRENFVSTSPGWVLCVIRFKHAVTFSRKIFQSPSLDGTEDAAERGDPLIISSDCLSISTRTDKESHIANLTATLIQGEVNYLSEIMPGDWVLAWMHNNEEDTARIVQNIKDKIVCNNFDDGLKFVGRVYSIRKKTAVGPAPGPKTVRFQLTGVGFSELDSQIFFDPGLANLDSTIATSLGRLGLAANNFLSEGTVDVNKAMSTLIELFFGVGIPLEVAKLAGETGLQQVTGSVGGTEDAQFAYVVPATVGNLMGKPARAHSSSGVLAYADLLETVIGIQKYTGSSQGSEDSAFPSIFIPDGITAEQPTMIRRTGLDLMGTTIPMIPQWTGKTVWTILHTYLNPVINEMYTCLRVNPEGQIMLTLVIRQLPFSSKLLERIVETEKASLDQKLPEGFIGPLQEGQGTFKMAVTTFLELPRWQAPTSLITSIDIGRANASRHNFIHVTGTSPGEVQTGNDTAQLVRNPPIRDESDIRRSGVRMEMVKTDASVEIVHRGPRAWTVIRADMLMGHHLTLSGSVEMFGVQAPICEGDNFELDGVVYHIESVVHNCGLDGNGNKYFRTTLQLDNGVNANFVERNFSGKLNGGGNVLNAETTVGFAEKGDAGLLADVALYAGLEADSQRSLDPALSYEGRDRAPDPKVPADQEFPDPKINPDSAI